MAAVINDADAGRRTVSVAGQHPSSHLTLSRCRGENYIEVDVDVGSSRTAANVVGTVQGSLKSLVIDLAVLLEGHSTVRSHLATASWIDG